ncbi:MAG: response regulator [Nitrososphaera sp.]
MLVVDDEADLLAATKTILEKNGYEVHAFDNADEAYRHIKEDGCKDCVVLVSDIKMPGMSGFELVRRIKAIQPEVKVVLTSSFIMHKGEFEKVMPSLHVDDLVSKPYTAEELIEAIRKYAKSESAT